VFVVVLVYIVCIAVANKIKLQLVTIIKHLVQYTKYNIYQKIVL
jgi:hypothetical protein